MTMPSWWLAHTATTLSSSGSGDVADYTPRQLAAVQVDHGNTHIVHVEVGHEREHEHHHDGHDERLTLGINGLLPIIFELLS